MARNDPIKVSVDTSPAWRDQALQCLMAIADPNGISHELCEHDSDLGRWVCEVMKLKAIARRAIVLEGEE